MLVLQPVDDVGDIADQHRRAVLVGEHDRLVARCRLELIVGADRVGLRRAVERTLGAGHVGIGDGGAQVLHAEPVIGEAGEIGLDTDGRLEATENADMADADQLAQTLADHRIGKIRHRADRDGLRGQRHRDHRGIGGIDLGIDRGIRQVFRQRRGGSVDRRLHILRGTVDIAFQVELQSDGGKAEGRGRGHRLQRWNLAELALQRRRDQLRHRIGVGARQLGGDLDGREVNLRQGRDRQGGVTEKTAQENGYREQRGRDRPMDKEGGDVHSVALVRFGWPSRRWRGRSPLPPSAGGVALC